jgi:elongation factor Ts
MSVTAQMVKELRQATGAAVLDCKKALEAHDGDLEKAKEYLVEKGLAAAREKAEREAREGVIETYSHIGRRVGVMVEVNCETDFVANTPQFREFAHDIALHVAFADPAYVDVGDVPPEIIEAKKAEFRQQAVADGKPENIVERIVEGKLDKFLEQVCLLRQPFVRDDEVSVGELLTQAIAGLKENIVIRRFARYELSAATDGPLDE